ncbi:hypothetical protein F5Y10DRAFT_285214 [Nemania abortiva]|nr:hypothetical protein F5Y10DRAFT_285214 [Nemania abortiva]
MSATPTPLLPAFGEKDFFNTVFDYNRDQIVQWLEACSKGEKGGDRTKIEEVKALLTQVYNRIIVLILPNGQQFRNPKVKPDSHFPRQLDPKWVNKTATPNEAKFILLSLPSKYQGALTAAITVSWWNPYDLLGLFLSVLGPAGVGATKKNFFLPLCAVYAKWCSRLAGRADGRWGWATPGLGEGVWPFMFNITWRPEGNPVTAIYFFLGSSTAGDQWKENLVGQWRARVQRSRFNVLYGALPLKPFKQDSFDKKNSPVELRTKGAGQCYGNCAETYPFIFSIRGTVDANRNLQGLALQKEFMSAENLKAYDESQVWKKLYGPCGNCSEIIKCAGASEKNFAPNYEEAKQTGAGSKPETTSQVATAMEEPTTTPAATAATAAPEGWSDKAEDLNVDYYWGTNGSGAEAAKRVGLTNPQGLYIVTRERGGDQYIFKDGTTGKIYLWGMLTDEIYEFIKPTDLDSIVAQMNLPVGKATMETKQLDDVGE